MKMIKTINTPLAEVSLLENGIIYLNYTVYVQDDVAIVRQQTEAIKNAFGTGLYVLVNSKKVKFVSREVRDFSATPEVLGASNAVALVVGNGLSRIIGNLYLNFNKPLIPMKLFTGLEKAEAWLLEEKTKRTTDK